MGDIMTSYASASSTSVVSDAWPFVTLPAAEFHRHGQHVHTLTNAHAVWTSPVVTNATGWETYALNLVRDDDIPTSSKIFAYGEVKQSDDGGFVMGKQPVIGQGPYAPIHQIHPFPPPLITSIQESQANYDMRSEPGMNATYASVDVLSSSVLSGLLSMDLFRDAYPESFDKVEPLSLLLQPVFRSFEDATVVAYVQSIVEWEYVFSNILVKDQSVFCVVENTCNQSFTFKIDAGNATFEGMGDSHAMQYDKHCVTNTIAVNESKEENAAAVETDACVYTLTVCPTAELRHSYDSNQPLVFTIVIGAVFFLMTATFFAYDRYVFSTNCVSISMCHSLTSRSVF